MVVRPDLVVVTVNIPESTPRVSLSPKLLPKTWRQTPPPPELATLGDNFTRHGRATILIVPSGLASSESNWLINPVHSGFSKIRVSAIEPFEYHPRFFADER
jgi:RES domain-containing protein